MTPSSSWTRSVPTPRNPSPGSTARRSCSIPGAEPSPSSNTPSASSKPIGCFPSIKDEICSEPLRDAILAALPGAPADLCGFTPARRSWYYDRFLKHSGWYPDRLLRVFRRNGVHFTQSGAHEHIDPNGRTRELDGDILHYPYKHFREHLDKINSYAQQGADDLAARGKKGGLALGVLHGIGRFLRIYLLKKGFLDGKAGFINAVHGAFYAFLKYVRVDEGNWGFPYNHR